MKIYNVYLFESQILVLFKSRTNIKMKNCYKILKLFQFGRKFEKNCIVLFISIYLQNVLSKKKKNANTNYLYNVNMWCVVTVQTIYRSEALWNEVIGSVSQIHETLSASGLRMDINSYHIIFVSIYLHVNSEIMLQLDCVRQRVFPIFKNDNSHSQNNSLNNNKFTELPPNILT